MLSVNNVATINNINDFKNYDVAHVIDFPLEISFSITKIICNLQKNVNLKQVIFSTRSFGYGALIKKISMLNIKILHLHSNTNNITFPLLRNIFKGKIIHTVHADVESRLGKKADLIICIHKDTYDKNKKFGNAKIIENTVDFPIRKEDLEFKDLSFFTNCRICDYYLSENMISTYSKIERDINIYGDMETIDDFQKIIKEKVKDTNVNILPWSNNIEEVMDKHGIYLFYQPECFPNRCYGLSVMEAVKYGIPIIALERKQDFQKYIIHDYNGFIVKNDTELIKYCNYLSSDRNKFNKMYENAYKHSSTIENTMPMLYEKAYKEFLK